MLLTALILFQNEKKLQDAQASRRKKRDELDALQIRMKQIHSELDRFSRGDDKCVLLSSWLFLSYFLSISLKLVSVFD